MPCFELFDEPAGRLARRGDRRAPVKIAVEAGIRMGWDAIIGADGVFVGMNGFGASAPVQGALRAFRHHGRGCRGGGCRQA